MNYKNTNNIGSKVRKFIRKKLQHSSTFSECPKAGRKYQRRNYSNHEKAVTLPPFSSDKVDEKAVTLPPFSSDKVDE